jgi:hypothetical protein
MNETIVARAPNTAGKAAWICLGIAWLAFLLPFPGLGLLGWSLNLVAFILAIVAMSKLGAMAGIFQLLSSLLISPFVYAIGLIIFFGSVNGAPDWVEWTHGHESFQQSGNDPAEEANQAAATHDADIARIEALADAASGAPPAQASVVAPAAASTR